MTAFLASVVSPAEAAIALDCGADIIDCTDPGRGALGAPEIRLLGPAVKRAQERGVARCFVSITHDAGVAAAVVVLEGDAG